ncbi:MAG: hypothetical protein QOD07_3150 [Frankiaceae bacterium]|jgi:hypothetical protein|nr:hypothetical protein [Frankiaceae bacterium]
MQTNKFGPDPRTAMSDRRVITLASGPTGAPYRDLLRGVAAVATFIGLIIRSPKVQLSPRADGVLAALTPFLVADDEVDAWPGTALVGSRRSRRLLFRVESASLDVLLDAAIGLFEWVNPQLPEDLHLLRADGTTVLGTVAQEEDAWLELDDRELGELMTSASQDLVSLLGGSV